MFVAVISVISHIVRIVPSLTYPYFQQKINEIKLILNKRIYEHALHLDYKYIDDPKYYDKYTRALDEYFLQTVSALRFIANFGRYMAAIVVLIALIAAIGPWILLVEAVQLFLQVKMSLYSNKTELFKKNELMPVNRRLSYFHRVFYMKEYVADLKSTQLADKVLDKYHAAGDKNVHIAVKYARKIRLVNIIQESLLTLTEFIVMVYLIYSISVGRILDVGLYITMILAFYRLDSNLHEFIGLISGAHELSINAQQIREFFALESHIEGQQGREAEKAENGVGKSTLVKLMLRLYDLSAGDILVNGTSIKDYDIYSLRKKIGVAFQNPNVYAMTYAENLSLYGEYADDEIRDINRKLGIEQIFSKNDADFDAEITREFDEKGMMMSSGETQKIAIARIMRVDFGLLILDEPSSALDPLSEYQMTRLILGEANKTTTVMIAHRLSTIRDADKIILIDDGGVKECGTHDELMSMRGKYYEMFTKQAENYVK